MTTVIFYEKPGCMNNTRQKQLLSDSGHEIVARNLLTEAWTPETLRPFFGDKPVAEWFNKAAPKVKSGEVLPHAFTEAEALAALCAEPLLIRRPLMAAEGHKVAGFDEAYVASWIGLGTPDKPMSEDCPRTTGHSCG